MLPPKEDPKWQALILSSSVPELKALPTKMLLMRIRLLAKDRTPQKMQEAINIAYDFFHANSLIIKDDIIILFGLERK